MILKEGYGLKHLDVLRSQTNTDSHYVL